MIKDILFINQRQPEYGQSLLYHGLYNLGHFVYPWFYSTFHYERLEECDMDCAAPTSPCSDVTVPIGCTNHPAHLNLNPPGFMEHEHILNKSWDLIVTNNGYGNERLHRHFRGQGIPIAALDLGDSARHSYEAWCEVLEGPPDFFFRREYYPGQPGRPLSYSFYRERARLLGADEIGTKLSISCLYRPTNPIRNIIGSEIKAEFENSFVGQKPHSEYLETLASSQFSVALPGAGQDTLRHWEIPSQGSVLCMPPSPITVNNQFTDGENCLIFNSVDELIFKIKYYLNSSPSVYNKLRENSFQHFMKYHTTEARAAEFLQVCGLS